MTYCRIFSALRILSESVAAALWYTNEGWNVLQAMQSYAIIATRHFHKVGAIVWPNNNARGEDIFRKQTHDMQSAPKLPLVKLS
jgi:hypothetical protein